jgi:hypothetical protein
MICMKPIGDAFPTLATFASGNPRKDPALSSIKSAIHFATLYSVNEADQ